MFTIQYTIQYNFIHPIQGNYIIGRAQYINIKMLNIKM